MTFEDVKINILNFVQKDPRGIYTLAIGTDSQAKSNSTLFVSAIMIYRLGKGAWGCMSKYSNNRKILNLREKISIETLLTQQIATKFTPDFLDEIIEIILPYINKGAEFHHEVHIDIGKKGDTKKLINEMTSYFAGMGFETKIKPESYVASSYADKYTK
ncbi:MAG: hypothetical protein FH761_10610 [Firmicutes bacterium]|nr:hypothetical protein [Bacillota bacterium]